VIVPTRFKGNLINRPCSASACKIACLIHHTAYEINLKPLDGSKRFDALINPKFPVYEIQ